MAALRRERHSLSARELHQPSKDVIHGYKEGVANVAEPHVCQGQHADKSVVQDAMLLAEAAY